MNENKMGTVPVNKLLVSMAAPMVLSMLVGALYNVVDSLFVSHYGENITVIEVLFLIGYCSRRKVKKVWMPPPSFFTCSGLTPSKSETS